MKDEDANTDVVYISPEELEADTAFLVGQAYGLILRVRKGESGPKLDHALDRFLHDCRTYHRKLYADKGGDDGSGGKW